MKYLLTILLIIITLTGCSKLRNNVGHAGQNLISNQPALSVLETNGTISHTYDTNTPTANTLIIIVCVIVLSSGLSVLYRNRDTFYDKKT